MVQGNVKHKVPHSGFAKKSHAAAKQRKITSKFQAVKKNKNSVQKIVKKNLEISIKSNIENELCGKVRSMEGKSFHLLKYEKDIESFRQCFKLYANEGFVSTPEKLGFIMRSLNIRPTIVELENYFQKHKKDDGQIDFAEFLSILHIHLQSENVNKEILYAFKMYDVNKTGYISVKELKSILTKTGERLSSKDVEMILQEVKPTKDGMIMYEEILKAISTPIEDY